MRTTKFEQPKNFVRNNTKGMNKSQSKRFWRKLKVQKNKNSSVSGTNR